MRRVAIVVLAGLMIAGISTASWAQKTDMTDVHARAAVMDVMNKMTDAYTKRDTSAFLSYIDPAANVVMFGTGADEKRVGIDQIKAQLIRDWSQSTAATMKYTWTLFGSSGNVAWVAADVAFHVEAGDQKMDMPARVTYVFEKHGEKWLLEQAHFSFAAPAQEPGQSFPEGQKE
jgi:ketosteroid isomerase-like protein